MFGRFLESVGSVGGCWSVWVAFGRLWYVLRGFLERFWKWFGRLFYQCLEDF